MHLTTLQRAFKMVMRGDNVFRSDEDRHAYVRGLTKVCVRVLYCVVKVCGIGTRVYMQGLRSRRRVCV